MKYIPIILIFIFLAMSCNHTKSNRLNVNTNTVKETDTSQTANTNTRYLITDNGVDIFIIGEKISNQQKNYEITKNIETRTEEGVDYEILIHTVSENNEDLLRIERLFMKSDKDEDNIDEIFIVSDKYKTSENIGINSTLDQFITAYPNYQIWFSYVSGIYVIETPKLQGVQFFLDGNDFIDKAGPSFNNDMTILKPSEFKDTTTIKTIRIWGVRSFIKKQKDT